MNCPCESGLPFSQCHGELDEPEQPRVEKPLYIATLPKTDGSVYKVVGPNEHFVRVEAQKALLWLRGRGLLVE